MRFSSRLWLLRLTGISVLSICAYFLIFGLLGKTNFDWLIPPVVKRTTWPDMPQFKATSLPANSSGSQEVHFTLPTRQITPTELSQFRRDYTNAAEPVSPTSPAR